MPLVLNKKTVGIPNGSVYIGRPSKFDSPYTMQSVKDNRQEVINMFITYLSSMFELVEAEKK
jgi:hypothetical protein